MLTTNIRCAINQDLSTLQHFHDTESNQNTMGLLVEIVKWFKGISYVPGAMVGADASALAVARDMASASHPIIMELNSTNLRGKDIERLSGLQMVPTSWELNGEATFLGADFEAKGSLSVEDKNAPLRAGQLSFSVPGLGDVEGKWADVNPDPNVIDEKLSIAFDKTYQAVESAHKGDVPDLKNLIQLSVEVSEDKDGKGEVAA